MEWNGTTTCNTYRGGKQHETKNKGPWDRV